MTGARHGEGAGPRPSAPVASTSAVITPEVNRPVVITPSTSTPSASTIGKLQRAMVLGEIGAAALIAWALASRGWPLPAALAAGLAAPVAVHGAIIATEFVLSALVGSPTPPEARLGPLAMLRTVLAEWAASLRTFQWLQPFRERAPMPQPAVARGIPVLLVHGYFCNRGAWLPLARFLAARGHPVDALSLEPPFGEIDGYAAQVAREVEALCARTGAERVALVGHSMGGIVIRAYLREHGAQRAACAITLGTPHRGTWLARLGHGRNVRQMGLDCDWLQALSGPETPQLRGLFTVVLSHHDNIVMPQAAQTLEGARNVALSGLGHMSLVFDARVHALVADTLQAAQDARPPGRAPSPAAAPEAGQRSTNLPA